MKCPKCQADIPNVAELPPPGCGWMLVALILLAIITGWFLSEIVFPLKPLAGH